VEFKPLVDCLKRIPAVNGLGLGSNNDIPGSYFPDGRWWVMFQIKLDDQMTWPVIRRLAEVLNDTSSPPFVPDPFPMVFRPVVPEFKPVRPESIPPLSIWWCLESTRTGFPIGDVVERMMARLPRPLDDATLWT